MEHLLRIIDDLWHVDPKKTKPGQENILTGSTLNQADVDATLRRVIKERFGGIIQVELMEGTGHFYKYGYWFVFHKDYKENQVTPSA